MLRRTFALIGFDIYGSENVQVIADAQRIPFTDGSFDAVVIQAVLEHVLEPPVVVAEIWRVLKPNGYVYAEAPFLRNVHEDAYDFTRFTESGHRWLFHDFELISSGPIQGPAAQLVWSASYLVWGLTRSRGATKASRALLSPRQLIDRIIPRRLHVDSATGVSFFGRRSESSIAPSRDHRLLFRCAVGATNCCSSSRTGRPLDSFACPGGRGCSRRRR